VRRNQSPLASFLHPDIGEAVVIVVPLLAVHALFVVDAGYYRRVAVHPNLHLGDLCQLHVRRGTRAVAQISGFALGTAILESDDKVFIQDSCEDFHLAKLVAIQHLQFERSDLSGIGWSLCPGGDE